MNITAILAVINVLFVAVIAVAFFSGSLDKMQRAQFMRNDAQDGITSMHPSVMAYMPYTLDVEEVVPEYNVVKEGVPMYIDTKPFDNTLSSLYVEQKSWMPAKLIPVLVSVGLLVMAVATVVALRAGDIVIFNPFK
jgi:hypothetical protein